MAGAFLIHYGGMMLFHLATPYLTIAPAMAAAVMRNRVLVPAHAWLYFLNLSRFSVDRRGHFRAVGETTTADLVTYKQKQREAAEEAKAKAVRAPPADPANCRISQRILGTFTLCSPS